MISGVCVTRRTPCEELLLSMGRDIGADETAC
jgi:hypothetical protein